jgi:hypothetical protein
MAENRTQPTRDSVEDFLSGVRNVTRAADSRTVLKLMQEVSGEAPRMWGASMVGFGSYHYRYESGREGDYFRMGFSPRAQALTLYIMDGFPRYESLLGRLGKHTRGKSCLYIRKLSDVDASVLQELVEASWEEMQRRHPPEG